MKWISVSEKLPKFNQRVLCYQPASDYLPDWVYEGVLLDSKDSLWQWDEACPHNQMGWNPTHWMPMPIGPLGNFDEYVKTRLSKEEIKEVEQQAKEEFESMCTDFTLYCLDEGSGCPRGARLRSALSKNVIKTIQDNWWSK